MNILLVIHGYPPYYMAGSEVYTFNLARELARKGHRVHVFTRVENPYESNYTFTDETESVTGIRIRRVNKARRDYTFQDKYLDPRMDSLFRDYLNSVLPDVVHVGHLSHLSTQIPVIARREAGIPVVFTVHDFWMGCPRGQLSTPEMKPCPGPSTEGCLACAKANFGEYVSRRDIEERHRHMATVLECIDSFLCPSRTVLEFYRQNGVPESKLTYSPYGFDTSLVRKRVLGDDHSAGRSGRPLTFGFMGRVIPIKGVALLLKAFHRVKGDARLLVHGSGENPKWLEAYLQGDERIHLEGAYNNRNVQAVLDTMDALVCPSLWPENSPLVIQEAFLAGIPVITSDKGGMAELVRDGVDGFTFPQGDEDGLSSLLQRLVDHPDELRSICPESSRVRTIADDVAECVRIYGDILGNRGNNLSDGGESRIRSSGIPHIPHPVHRAGPWRMTFVTNPDKCNLACRMCDTHSVLRPETDRESRPRRPELSMDVVERVMRDACRHGLREIIPSTMGEPLLYGGMERMLELAKELNLSVNLTTNGTFPRLGVAKWAELILPVLSDVKISVNGVSKEVNESVMCSHIQEFHLMQRRNIQDFVTFRDDYQRRTGRRPTVTFQPTFMRRNLEELPGLLEWAVELGVDRIKGHHLWITWPELEGETLRTEEMAPRWNDMVERLNRMAETMTTGDGRRIQLVNFLPLDLDSPQATDGRWACPFVGKEAWIEHDGSFQVCCCPDDVRKDFGRFGNVKDGTPFAALWESDAYRDFVHDWGSHPNCRKCNMRQPICDDGAALF